MNRRHFLGTMAMALGSGAAGEASAGGAQQAREMVQRKIPAASNGESVPVIGMGTWNTFDVGGGAGERAPVLEGPGGVGPVGGMGTWSPCGVGGGASERAPLLKVLEVF